MDYAYLKKENLRDKSILNSIDELLRLAGVYQGALVGSYLYNVIVPLKNMNQSSHRSADELVEGNPNMGSAGASAYEKATSLTLYFPSIEQQTKFLGVTRLPAVSKSKYLFVYRERRLTVNLINEHHVVLDVDTVMFAYLDFDQPRLISTMFDVRKMEKSILLRNATVVFPKDPRAYHAFPVKDVYRNYYAVGWNIWYVPSIIETNLVITRSQRLSLEDFVRVSAYNTMQYYKHGYFDPNYISSLRTLDAMFEINNAVQQSPCADQIREHLEAIHRLMNAQQTSRTSVDTDSLDELIDNLDQMTMSE